MILGSTMTVHFLPFMLHWMGLVMFTCSFLFSLGRGKKRWTKGIRLLAGVRIH